MRKSNEMWEKMGINEILDEVKKAMVNAEGNKRVMTVWTTRATYYYDGKDHWEKYVYRAAGAKFDWWYTDADVLKALKLSLGKENHYAGYRDDNNNVVFENSQLGNVQRW